MRFHILALILIIFSQVSLARGRGPAVEDFVGIDIEHPESTPQGTENLFNFEKDINKFQEDKNKNQTNQISSQTTSSNSPDLLWYVGIFTLFSLPAVMSLLMMHQMKKKAKAESQNNIKVLEDFRRQKQESKKSDEEVKKAS